MIFQVNLGYHVRQSFQANRMNGKSGHGLKAYLSMFDAQAAAFMDQHELDPDGVTDEDLALNTQDELGDLVVDREATARRVTFSRKLHYMFANLTTESARLTVRQNYESNGFETWRRLVKKYSLPDATRHVSLLTHLLDLKFNPQNLVQDFQHLGQFPGEE